MRLLKLPLIQVNLNKSNFQFLSLVIVINSSLVFMITSEVIYYPIKLYLNHSFYPPLNLIYNNILASTSDFRRAQKVGRRYYNPGLRILSYSLTTRFFARTIVHTDSSTLTFLFQYVTREINLLLSAPLVLVPLIASSRILIRFAS